MKPVIDFFLPVSLHFNVFGFILPVSALKNYFITKRLLYLNNIEISYSSFCGTIITYWLPVFALTAAEQASFGNLLLCH